MPSMQVVGHDLVLGKLMLKRDEELSALCDRQAEVPNGCLVYGAAEGCQRSFPRRAVLSHEDCPQYVLLAS